ncbi:MAG TPA: hypothetical protein VFG89_00370 [Coriobacteriia bacterium]|nr:hypothetical protein [Coriobacteriia bacterium]
MDFGDIIKRSWKITWRYKALWVLGLFAGLSGCQPSGGGNSGGSSNSSSLGDFGSSGTSGFSSSSLHSFGQEILRYLPVIIAVGIALFMLSVLWSIASIAARAALVVGADEADRGTPRKLGELWSHGFHHFWQVVGLGIVLKLPVIAAALFVAVLAIAPVVGAVSAGSDFNPASLVPLCGVLFVGLPVLVIGGVVLDVMYLLGLRYLVLGGQGVMESAGNAWRFFRARFKDTALMYVINGGLNLAGSFVLAIPLVVLGIAMVLPVIGAVSSGDWRVLVAPVAAFVVLVMLMSYFYTGVWGTFTSAMWTLFFRASMAPVAAAVAPAAASVAPAPLPVEEFTPSAAPTPPAPSAIQDPDA